MHASSLVFFFNDPATTEIYTLSLHDALPIFSVPLAMITSLFLKSPDNALLKLADPIDRLIARDRKSTRLNSSHVEISYAVFCLKKKNRTSTSTTRHSTTHSSTTSTSGSTSTS